MKAQAELDRVVTGRLPDFDDMDELPYLSAIVKEVLRLVCLIMKIKIMPTINISSSSLRWQPITPCGKFIHTNIKDLFQ